MFTFLRIILKVVVFHKFYVLIMKNQLEISRCGQLCDIYFVDNFKYNLKIIDKSKNTTLRTEIDW